MRITDLIQHLKEVPFDGLKLVLPIIALYVVLRIVFGLASRKKQYEEASCKAKEKAGTLSEGGLKWLKRRRLVRSALNLGFLAYIAILPLSYSAILGLVKTYVEPNLYLWPFLIISYIVYTLSRMVISLIKLRFLAWQVKRQRSKQGNA